VLVHQILSQYGCDERFIVHMGRKGPLVAALASVPNGDHAARWQTARALRLLVLAGADSTLGRTCGCGLAGSGLARHCGGRGHRDSGRTDLQLPCALPASDP